MFYISKLETVWTFHTCILSQKSGLCWWAVWYCNRILLDRFKLPPEEPASVCPVCTMSSDWSEKHFPSVVFIFQQLLSCISVSCTSHAINYELIIILHLWVISLSCTGQNWFAKWSEFVFVETALWIIWSGSQSVKQTLQRYLRTEKTNMKWIHLQTTLVPEDESPTLHFVLIPVKYTSFWDPGIIFIIVLLWLTSIY